MRVVFDASVAAKWIFSEVGSKESTQLLLDADNIFEPDFFEVELNSIISKKVRTKQISLQEAHNRRNEIQLLSSTTIEFKRISGLAFEFSITLPITFYDALYVATAVLTESTLITADERLVWGLSNTKLSNYVKSIYK